MSRLKIFLQLSQKLLQRLLGALQLKRNHGFPTKSSIFVMKDENLNIQVSIQKVLGNAGRLIRMSGTPSKKIKKTTSRSTIVKKAYQLVKELTGKKQDKVNIIEDKNGEIITQDENIHGRWSEYCEDLYNHEYHGDQIVLESPEPTKWENQLILKHEIEAVIKSLKKENRLELIIF